MAAPACGRASLPEPRDPLRLPGAGCRCPRQPGLRSCVDLEGCGAGRAGAAIGPHPAPGRRGWGSPAGAHIPQGRGEHPPGRGRSFKNKYCCSFSRNDISVVAVFCQSHETFTWLCVQELKSELTDRLEPRFKNCFAMVILGKGQLSSDIKKSKPKQQN